MNLNVGLTGGIASGKSTVSLMLAQAGFTVIDYDLIARKIVEPGSEGISRIVAEFGPEFIDSQGNLDRARMGALVFSDKTALRTLEGITHPLILREAQAQAEAAAGIVIHDNPLLVEMGAHTKCDVVIVVDVSEEEQIQRMMRDRGMSEDEARQRMANQMARAERLAVADIIIDNSGDLADLKVRVDQVIDELRLSAAE